MDPREVRSNFNESSCNDNWPTRIAVSNSVTSLKTLSEIKKANNTYSDSIKDAASHKFSVASLSEKGSRGSS